jgi:hypothetical protein
MTKKVITRYNGEIVETRFYFLGIRINKTVYEDYESEAKPSVGFKQTTKE